MDNKQTNMVTIPESKCVVIGHAMCKEGYEPTMEGLSQFLLDSAVKRAEEIEQGKPHTTKQPA